MTIHFKLTYAQLQTTPIGEWITITTEHGFSYLYIRGKYCMISLEKQPTNFNRGPFHAKLDVFNPSQMDIDFNDGWSVGRYYFDLDRAKAEVEAWLKAWNQLEDNRLRQDVLCAFAVEPNRGCETLEQYLSDYPQYASALVELSYELSRKVCEDEAPLSDEDKALIEKTWQRIKEGDRLTDDPL